MSKKVLFVALAAAAVSLLASSAEAKRARCYTSDDGYYPCRFKSTDASGSFEISGRGVPSYSIVVESRGFAFGYVNFGNRGIPISGMFVRQSDDPACWSNPEVNVKVCAW